MVKKKPQKLWFSFINFQIRIYYIHANQTEVEQLGLISVTLQMLVDNVFIF